MKSGYLVAGAGLLQAVRAIPAYITTVFDCPDVVTITQTVYPPGWTNTGPVYETMTYGAGGGGGEKPNPTYAGKAESACTESAAVTTSWETEYATTSVYFSEYGMYSGPPGCPSEIIAYMPTTVTCSQAVSTAWVGYVEDIACASCTATTLVGMKPSYNVTAGSTVTYVTIWTEAYIEQGATTHASVIGQVYTTSVIPTNIYPYNKYCSVTPYANGGGETPYTYGGGGGAPGPQYTYTHAPGAYPSIDFSDPNAFHGGESIEIQSAGWTSGKYPTPTVAPAGATYTSSKGGYPSMDFNDPNLFNGGQSVPIVSAGASTYTAPGSGNARTTETYTTPAGTIGPQAENTDRPKSYPINYSDTSVFGPLKTSVGIVSATVQPESVAPTATYVVPTSYTANYASIDPNASENFKPLTGGISIVSLATPQTFATPITTATYNTATTKSVNYPSIDFSNPSLFKPVDPNAAQPTNSA